MMDLLIRFFIGGIVVSVFAVIGDMLKPKTFAGLFGAAPSVALATLGLTVLKDGTTYAALEARSMIAGALAFFVYASFVGWVMMRYKPKALWSTVGSMPLWLGTALGVWYVWLK